MSADKSKIKLVVYGWTREAGNNILNLAHEYGWAVLHNHKEVITEWNCIIFNWSGYSTGAVTWSSGEDPQRLAAKAGWLALDVSAGLDELTTILRGEPEFDTTPLPYDMTPELQSETMAKFNLSQDQWELMPLMVREALAGCEVKQQEQVVKFDWYPVSQRPDKSQTVFLTAQILAERNSATSHNAFGFWDGDDWQVTTGSITPRSITHWCPMPGGDVEPEEQ